MAYYNGIQRVRDALVVATPGRRANNCNIEIAYTNTQGAEQHVILRVNRATVLRDANGCRLGCGSFAAGQTVNAAFSEAMTRSLPPQARAYSITRTSVANGTPIQPRLGIDIDMN